MIICPCCGFESEHDDFRWHDCAKYKPELHAEMERLNIIFIIGITLGIVSLLVIDLVFL